MLLQAKADLEAKDTVSNLDHPACAIFDDSPSVVLQSRGSVEWTAAHHAAMNGHAQVACEGRCRRLCEATWCAGAAVAGERTCKRQC